MFRFTIRDVLWLLLAVGLAAAWQRELLRGRSKELEWESERRAIQAQHDAEVYKLKNPWPGYALDVF